MPQDLGTDGGKVGEAINVGGRDGSSSVVGRGEIAADLVAEARLDVRVQAQQVDGPGHGRRGRLVAGGEEGHHLVDKVVVSEGAALEGHRQYVDAASLVGLLFLDEFAAGGANDGRGLSNIAVAFERQSADDRSRPATPMMSSVTREAQPLISTTVEPVESGAAAALETCSERAATPSRALFQKTG
ncbi:hypothetical protein HYQ46_005456 [Verticillium longisporum]|nr:hypothetical protein HYQ46_005456 [Verticillium longisporum]